jgi:hypothetical protein
VCHWCKQNLLLKPEKLKLYKVLASAVKIHNDLKNPLKKKPWLEAQKAD